MLRVDSSFEVPMYWQLMNQNVLMYAAFSRAFLSLSERVMLWFNGSVLEMKVLLMTVSFCTSCISPLSILVKLNEILAVANGYGMIKYILFTETVTSYVPGFTGCEYRTVQLKRGDFEVTSSNLCWGDVLSIQFTT